MEKFYLGMDIGTESVGMACTDENYKLLRAKGKDLWAVRLFDEAKSAADRRTKRAARRRLARRSQRIDLLQEVFAPFMEDETFFLRLNNSAFYSEDKNADLKTKYSLFADDDYTDKDFHKSYPTIFHLRKDLIDGNVNSIDLRLYYLAIHHIVKYRGHFLFEGESTSAVQDIKALIANLNCSVEEVYQEDEVFVLPIEKADAFKELALSKGGLNDKKRESLALLGGDAGKKKAYIDLMLGSKVKITDLFDTDDEELKKEKLSFKEISDEDFEKKQEEYGDYFEPINCARSIYSFLKLQSILKGYENVSAAMVGIYEKHKEDLRILKAFVRNYCEKDAYKEIFKKADGTLNNYVRYIGYTKPQRKKIKIDKCTPEEFFTYLKKALDKYKIEGYDEETYNYIKSEIDGGNFLPKILHADGGLFPHQLNGQELDAILSNMAKNYPAFLTKDEEGYSAIEKIKAIFRFKIPYYVGPLNDAHSTRENANSWIVKKSTGRITPWNFNDKVDLNACNEKFIKRMTNKCSYLIGKDVLPKCSMYYQAYDVLNQINKIKIDEKPISVELKQKFFNDLFLKRKKVTKKDIVNYLVLNGHCTREESKNVTISGFDGELKANMGSYITLKNILGDYVDEKPAVCEDIILRHTLCTDKQLVEDYLLANYGNDPLIKENIKKIKGITSFKEFGSLSKELLTDVCGGIDEATGIAYSILERLYNTNYNFNQLIFANEYKFQKAIDEENGVVETDITYEDVDALYVSPLVKRGVWQSLLMVDEYVNAVGRAPDKIFIEVTRKEEKEKKRSVTRKNQILGYYSGIGKDCRDIDKLTEELNQKTDSQLRSERLYLYFMQLGKCAYSGEVIDLAKLSTDLYDVDHILPRSMTKDDSLDNKVLVLRSKNAEKTDNYPIPQGFTNQQAFWKVLKDKGLMSEKKYALLTRTKPLDGDDFQNFINRQLVVTNQTVKAVADLLRRKFSAETKVVFSKASNVTDFRNRFNIVKCRETNDLHHARDAYLNVVVGNIYDTKFTCAYDYFYRKGNDAWREYNLKKLYDFPINGAWKGKTQLDEIKSVLAKPSMQVTRYSYVNKGAFYNETVFNSEDGGIQAPRKNVFPYTQTEKYGGYKSLTTAYFAIVKSKKKGKVIKTIEAVPVIVDYNCRGDKNALLKYFIDKGLEEPEILVEKLKVKSLISVNGFNGWISGITGSSIIIHNAQQWFTDAKTDTYVKDMTKLLEQDRQGKISDSEKNGELFVMSTNRFGEVKSSIDRKQNEELYEKILNKLSLTVYRAIPPCRTFSGKLIAKVDEFNALSCFYQVKVLHQIIKFMKCNAEPSDLSLLKEGSTCGKILIGKDISNVNFEIINQSPCGLITRIKKV